MNINPLYLQEVSREYYTKILNNSRQQKAAAKLTKNWLAKNPKASVDAILNKSKDFSKKVHYKYDKVRNRNKDNTYLRKCFISGVMKLNKTDPKELAKKYGNSDPEYLKDEGFKDYRNIAKSWRQKRLKKLDKSKIADIIFNL